MRETLFRGQRVDNKEWVEGFYCKSIHCVKGKGELRDYIQVEHSPYELTAHEVIPETVSQYTGLTDKNDVKIFEGDILEVVVLERLNSNDEIKHKRIYHGKPIETLGHLNQRFTYWSVEHKIHNSSMGFFTYGIDRRWFKELTNSRIANCQAKVIGNIYDNPELMEV